MGGSTRLMYSVDCGLTIRDESPASKGLVGSPSSIDQPRGDLDKSKATRLAARHKVPAPH
jgi:hypothetical protein